MKVFEFVSVSVCGCKSVRVLYRVVPVRVHGSVYVRPSVCACQVCECEYVYELQVSICCSCRMKEAHAN